jgi:hypothetical protein
VALVLFFLMVLGVGVAQPAGAQDQPPAGQPTINSWAMTPTGTDPTEPSSRPYLSYELDPGATVQDSVTLWNYGNTQMTFRIYPTDAYNTVTGSFELLAGDKAPTDAGAWVTMPQPNVTVPAHAKIDLPITLTVPPDARPGDHAGAVLASSQVLGTGPDGKTVTVDRRTGTRIYLRVHGALNPSLSVENVHTVYHAAVNPFGGSLDVDYTVRNTGNLRLSGHQHIGVKNPLGKEMKQQTPPDVPELLPGNAITLHAHFSGVTAAFRLSTTITVTPFFAATGNAPAVAAGPPLTAVSASAKTWAIPWSAFAALFIAWLLWRVYSSRRRTRRRQPSSPASGRAGAPASAPDREIVRSG